MMLGTSAVAAALVIWFFHWTVRGSGGFNPPGEEDYYNFLARGWRSGQLHMSKEPVREMHALADPYDPAQNGPFRLGDASYYKGRYYLYFGAAPAALTMLPYYYITGRELATTTTVFFFGTIGFLAASAFWLELRKRFFPASATWLAPVGILILGFGTHVLALQRRPLVWELPIAAAYAFTMLGLWALAKLVERQRVGWALFGGICFGLAAASRPTYIFASAAVVPVLWFVWRHCQNRIRLVGGFTCAFGLCIIGILAHNYARFENPFEFGQNFQLTSIYESKAEHFRARYIPHNLSIYYLQRPQGTSDFPYISATVRREGPAGYLGSWNEAVCGIALTLPFLWFALAAPTAVAGRVGRERRELSCVISAAAFLFLAMSGVTLAYFLATPRYMADFTPALALVALIGALGAEQLATTTPWKLIVRTSFLISGVLTVCLGALMSLDYHGRLLEKLSPAQWQALQSFFE